MVKHFIPFKQQLSVFLQFCLVTLVPIGSCKSHLHLKLQRPPFLLRMFCEEGASVGRGLSLPKGGVSSMLIRIVHSKVQVAL